MRKLIFLITILLITACNNRQSHTPTSFEKVKLYTSEPFVTIEIREDLNFIKVNALDPSGTNMVNYTYSYTPSIINGGFKEHTFGGIYSTGDVMLWYVRYKTAIPAGSCQRPMEGSMMDLTANLSINGSTLWHGCGENIP